MKKANVTKHNSILIFVVIILTALSMLFLIKPIRMRVITYAINILSCASNTGADETPDIDKGDIYLKTIEPVTNSESFTFISRSNEDIHKGSLILVSSDNLCSFMEQDNLINIKQHKNRSYKIMDNDMKLSSYMLTSFNQMMSDFEKATHKHDMIITSAYRGLKEQNKALEEKEAEFGEKEALKWAMLPGYSEHHTGYALDMSICTDDDIYIKYKGQEPYDWINQNCFKYGIVRRYMEDKSDLTGVSGEPWHYRYVGMPHAYLMTVHDMCLEEYIDYLKRYTFEDEHLWISVKDLNYEIYYVPANIYISTLIPVPKDRKYYISGNNTDGFIVTIYF